MIYHCKKNSYRGSITNTCDRDRLYIAILLLASEICLDSRLSSNNVSTLLTDHAGIWNPGVLCFRVSPVACCIFLPTLVPVIRNPVHSQRIVPGTSFCRDPIGRGRARGSTCVEPQVPGTVVKRSGTWNLCYMDVSIHCEMTKSGGDYSIPVFRTDLAIL